jgi:hypothetical protein
MTLFASNPDGFILPLLLLAFGGGCLLMVSGCVLIVSGRNEKRRRGEENGAKIVIGILLVMLGLLPLLFLIVRWLAVY